jgi:hypothetical protein
MRQFLGLNLLSADSRRSLWSEDDSNQVSLPHQLQEALVKVPLSSHLFSFYLMLQLPGGSRVRKLDSKAEGLGVMNQDTVGPFYWVKVKSHSP